MSEDLPQSWPPPAPPSRERSAGINIIGVGAVTGYGWGRKHVWDGFLLGESAVKLVTGLDELRGRR